MTWREIVEKLYELEKTNPRLSRRIALVNTGTEVFRITGLMTARECECSDGEDIHDRDIVLDTQSY